MAPAWPASRPTTARPAATTRCRLDALSGSTRLNPHAPIKLKHSNKAHKKVPAKTKK